MEPICLLSRILRILWAWVSIGLPLFLSLLWLFLRQVVSQSQRPKLPSFASSKRTVTNVQAKELDEARAHRRLFIDTFSRPVLASPLRAG